MNTLAVTGISSKELVLSEAVPASGGARSSGLLECLASALEQAGIGYCQWKGHWSAHRWSTGYGDIDLLVDHEEAAAFRRVVEQLGFKLGQSSGARQILGTEHYLGHDPAVSRLLHLHVHYRLLMGDYWKPVYRIPIERSLLENTVPGIPFRVPAYTHQYLVFVLRLMLRQVGRPLLSAQKQWTNGIRVPLESLEAAASREDLDRILQQHLGALDVPFFERCVRSLQGDSGLLERAALPWELHRRLRAHVRAPSLPAILLAAVEKWLPGPVAQWISDSRLRPAAGGLVVALVGGDGSGKSTCARELNAWLNPVFPSMRAHLGNPPRSLLTLLVGAALKIRQRIDRTSRRAGEGAGSIELLRHLCTARDRYRLYLKARRFALRGGIAVCERYPILENRALVGPTIPQLLSTGAGSLHRLLAELEASYYRKMVRPDLILVLRLHPDLAVARKPEEPADYVRSRGQIIWDTDWSSADTVAVDAAQPLEQVLARLKAIIWPRL